MSKKISHSELIRHLDTPKTKTPLFTESIRTLSDEGFRNYISEVEKVDKKRRADFVKENPGVYIAPELRF